MGRRAAGALVLCALLCGCALKDPYSARTAARATRPPAGAPPAGQADGPPAPAGGGQKGYPDARQALGAYARLYANWTWRTLPAVARRLEQISTGQARQAAAALAPRAAQLARWRVADTGQVAAIAPASGPRAGQWAVVTIEQTTGQGPYSGLPATSQVTWALVARTRAGYEVSGWLPSP
jgi:hypothetical protein